MNQTPTGEFGDDITELRRLEKIRKDFVANVSHELRTPVSVIGAAAGNLADGVVGDPLVVAGQQRDLHRLHDRALVGVRALIPPPPTRT